jgi:hypothetical protein
MSLPHTGARIGRPPSRVRLVRELPLVLEPVTHDPFIDDCGERRPVAGKALRSQRELVRESLLRCTGSEERL